MSFFSSLVVNSFHQHKTPRARCSRAFVLTYDSIWLTRVLLGHARTTIEMAGNQAVTVSAQVARVEIPGRTSTTRPVENSPISTQATCRQRLIIARAAILCSPFSQMKIVYVDGETTSPYATLAFRDRNCLDAPLPTRNVTCLAGVLTA